MPVSAPPRAPDGSRLMQRRARPLTGLEISEAIKHHIVDLACQLLKRSPLSHEFAMLMVDDLRDAMIKAFEGHSRLGKVHMVYPKVAWKSRVLLERVNPDATAWNLIAECDLQLDRNTSLELKFSKLGQGDVIDSLEEDRLPTDTPDHIREQFGIAVEVEFLKPSGEVGKVNLNELRQSEGPKRAARTVDVGSGAENLIMKQVPSGPTEYTEIPMVSVSEGEEITLPSIPLEDLMAEPPKIETPPPTVPPPPPGGIQKTPRPNIKFKGK